MAQKAYLCGASGIRAIVYIATLSDLCKKMYLCGAGSIGAMVYQEGPGHQRVQKDALPICSLVEEEVRSWCRAQLFGIW